MRYYYIVSDQNYTLLEVVVCYSLIKKFIIIINYYLVYFTSLLENSISSIATAPLTLKLLEPSKIILKTPLYLPMPTTAENHEFP